MTKFNVEEANKLSFKNRDNITNDTPCGCYFCMETYTGKDIEEWTDDGQTAICPHCTVDSVLPNETDEDNLVAAFERWFTGEVSE